MRVEGALSLSFSIKNMNNGYVWKGPTLSSDGTNSVDFTSGFGYVASPKKTREY